MSENKNSAMEKAIKDMLIKGTGAVLMIDPAEVQAKDDYIAELEQKANEDQSCIDGHRAKKAKLEQRLETAERLNAETLKACAAEVNKAHHKVTELEAELAKLRAELALAIEQRDAWIHYGSPEADPEVDVKSCNADLAKLRDES